MSESLDDWIEKYSALKVLVKNLRANLDAVTELNADEKKMLI